MGSFPKHHKLLHFPVLIISVGTTLVLAAILMRPPRRAGATEIPLSTKHTVAGNFDGAQSVYAADLDGDGDLDLLGSALNADDLAWWENTDGAGTFGSANTITNNFDGSLTAQAADVDGDGDLDVIGAASNANAVAWWENTDGSGSFGAIQNIDTTFTGSSSVEAADIDGDGDLDVLGAARDADTIAWWQNTAGDGSTWTKVFINVGTVNGPVSALAADFDRDGDLDVLVAEESDNEVTWWENANGSGTSWTSHGIENSLTSVQDIFTADVDGDGDQDVIGAIMGENSLFWWENLNGTGLTWSRRDITHGFAGAHGVASTDLDGDGDQDVLAAAQTGNQIAWWENSDGAGTTWITYTVDTAFTGASAVFAADVDSDGDPDILGAAQTADSIVWWENETIHRNARFLAGSELTVSSNFGGAQAVFSADLDGDGDQDLLGAASIDDTIAWFDNTAGDGSTWSAQTITNTFTGAVSVDAADLDADGDLDVLGAALSDDTIAWFENIAGDGSLWTPNTIDASFSEADSVQAADLDGDGDLDVLGAARLGNSIAWWQNTDGSGTFGGRLNVDTAFQDASSVAAADLDGDGDNDILGTSLNNVVAWWENTDGSGSFGTVQNIDTGFTEAAYASAIDVDGDGDLDVIAAASAGQEFAWWENALGDASTWSKHSVGSGMNGAAWITGADLDKDGDTDLIGAAQNANSLAWWENTLGDGSAWSQHVVTSTLTGAASVFTADLDGDGDTDLASAASGANDISWWPNLGGQFGLKTSVTAPPALFEGQQDDILEIRAAHLGRAGDAPVELSTFEFLLEEDPGNGMGSFEANALIENLFVYLDDGSGVYEMGSDTLILTLPDLSTFAGELSLLLPSGDPNFQVSYGITKTYFIVTELTQDAGVQSPNQFMFTHLTDGSMTSSSAFDGSHTDIPLNLEGLPNVSTPIIFAFAPDLFISKTANPANAPSPSLTNPTVGLLPPPVQPGEVITYTIQYSNTGGTSATNVIITDLMPPEVAISRVISSGTPITQTVAGALYTWEIGTLMPNTTGIITLTGTISPAVASEYIFVNIAVLNGTVQSIVFGDTSDAGLEINIPPSVDAGPDQDVSVGEKLTLLASFTDPGFSDTHTALINWGDGNITNGSLDQAAHTVTGSHRYLSLGNFTITVTVEDSDEDVGSDSMSISVGQSKVYLPVVIR